jgi:quercetin dioxygenase-like cupin family protein
MMAKVIEQLETSTHPVAKPLRVGVGFKVIVIGFKSGMILKEHKTALPAKLVVLNGVVIYIEGDKRVVLHQYEEVEIPADVTHAVECVADALCLLIQG